MPGNTSSPLNASYFDSHLTPNATSGNPGRTYRYYDGPVAYAFGDGLSYSTFATALLAPRGGAVAVDAARVAAHAAAATAARAFTRGSRALGGTTDAVLLRVALRVTNSGDRDGATSLLAFVEVANPLLSCSPLLSCGRVGTNGVRRTRAHNPRFAAATGAPP